MDEIKKKKKSPKRFIFPAIVAVITVLLIVGPFLIESKNGAGKASIISVKAQKATVSRTLSGTGTLSQEKPVEVTVPSGVKLTQFLVENGDEVSAGDAVAIADRVSVMKTITTTQKKLDSLSKQIEAASDKKLSSKITAGAAGRVMKVYGKAGQRVEDVMLENGALALISLDGKLAVRFETDASLATGKTVSVVLPSGKKINGSVEKCVGGSAVVTVTDNGTVPGAAVTVMNGEETLGEGELYIHSELKVTGFSGKISKVNTSAGTKVKKDAQLFTLTSLDYEAEFERLSAERTVYEDNMAQLFKMYQTQLVTAENSGYVSGVDEESSVLLSAKDDGEIVLLSNAPNGDDGQIYINYVGKLEKKESGEMTLRMCPEPQMITDYKALDKINISDEKMSSTLKYTPAPETPVFILSGGSWYKGSVDGLAQGDTLLFSYDMTGSNLVWIVRVSEKEKPDDKSPSDTPGGGNGQGSGNSGHGFPSGGYGGWSGNLADLFGGKNTASVTQQQAAAVAQNAQAKAKEESETTVMSIVPLDEMTLDVTIDELDILTAQLGQKAVITVDALPSQAFYGEVTGINGTGSNSGGNSKYTVTLTLKRSEKMLDGMNASATITLESEENVISLPVAALVDDAGKTVVYTQYDKKEGLGGKQEVTTGISDGETVRIVSGLDEGSTVWYEYYEVEKPSFPVTPFS